MSHKPLEPNVQALISLVDYQHGAIVSRTLIKKDGGNVTLFAFDADENLSEHSTPHDALAFVLEGVLEITIGGELNQLHAGDILLLPASIPHTVLAKSQCKMLLMMIHE